jgi:hypothetical protein
VTLDTIGIAPTFAEVAAFRADRATDKRLKAIDRLLSDPRWADHWVSYWQDVLAENPGILKPTLNNTGPFRWWLHEALGDNKPFDRLVTELVLMEGSVYAGGTAAFGIASENDAPMAAKADVLARAFLGLEMQCARCHDAPYHPFKQAELFSLAAMLGRGPQKVPKTSVLEVAPGARVPHVQISLKPGQSIPPRWPFPDWPSAELSSSEIPAEFGPQVKDSRARFAFLLTSPANERFAQVLVNRVWKRYIGIGIVEPVDDWNNAIPSHPELLDWLARDFASHGFDLKHLARRILRSETYQRRILPQGLDAPPPSQRLFASGGRRRLSAEQLVDSLFASAGKEFNAEELNMDVDGRRPIDQCQNMGTPRRSWELTSLSNERDRPALALPVAQGIVDLLGAYGWRESRPNPITVRDETPTPLQPLVLANGVVGSRVIGLSEDHAVTPWTLEEVTVDQLVERVFLHYLARLPRTAERAMFGKLLEPGFAGRRIAIQEEPATRIAPRRTVSWSNHLSPEATRIKLEQEKAARAGDPPTPRLTADWRERMEDLLWSLVNSPEYMFVP